MSPVLVEELVIPQIRWGAEEVILEPTPKRVRAFAGGELVVDSRRAVMMLETGHLPVYYFPKQDVRMDLLTPALSSRPPGRKGPVTLWSVGTDGGVVGDAFFSYEETPAGCPELSGLIGMYWSRMDTIFEEEEEVFGHARDPRHRVEVLRSSRHIRVVSGGTTLAESRRTLMLLETNLPTRFYIPKLDVDFNELRPTTTRSMCPYKGKATQYWATKDGDTDVAWCYPAAKLECSLISNHVAFYSEHVDVYVDGVLLRSQDSPFA
jgi:uncharacterized protein (DUF427 family)